MNGERLLLGAELPESWALASMGDIAVVVGGSTPKSKEPAYWGGSIPWLAVSDLTDHVGKYISGGARTITPAGFASCATRLLPRGSVIFSSRAPIGYVAITTEPLCTSQGFRSFVPAPSMSQEYLYWYLKAAKPLAESRASGTTFKEISGRAAKTIPVPIPPRPEQDLIVEALESLLERVDAGLTELNAIAPLSDIATDYRGHAYALKRSILQRAFTGRLVPQNSRAESAADLLARLQDERVAREHEVKELGRRPLTGETAAEIEAVPD